MKVWLKVLLFLLLFPLPASRIQAQPYSTFVVLRCNTGDTTNFQYLADLMDYVTFIPNWSPITVLMSPAWVDSAFVAQSRINTMATWLTYGHEVGGLHVDASSASWDGYTNDPAHFSDPGFIDSMGTYYYRLRGVCYDSMFATLAMGPTEPPSMDWSPYGVYRVRTHMATDSAFGSVYPGWVGTYPVCEVRACEIHSQDSLIAVIDKFSVVGAYQCGLVFDLDEVSANFNMLDTWLTYVGQHTVVAGRNSVRNGVRESGLCGLQVEREKPQSPSMNFFWDAGRLRVTFPDGRAESEALLQDVSGRTLMRIPATGGAYEAELGTLSPGVYLFSCLQQGRQQSRRFAVIR